VSLLFADFVIYACIYQIAEYLSVNMKTVSKKQHGGKRPRSGRPSMGERITITIRLPVSAAANLRAICKARKQSQSAVITDALSLP
jgi:hypothetical protein